MKEGMLSCTTVWSTLSYLYWFRIYIYQGQVIYFLLNLAQHAIRLLWIPYTKQSKEERNKKKIVYKKNQNASAHLPISMGCGKYLIMTLCTSWWKIKERKYSKNIRKLMFSYHTQEWRESGELLHLHFSCQARLLHVRKHCIFLLVKVGQ